MQHLQVPTAGGLVLDAWAEGPDDAAVALLLHGFPQSAWCWREVQPVLAEAGLRAVALDQRGYSPGARPASTEAYRMSNLVADALAVLDALDAPSAHLVGHDWGAAVAWQVAAHHPQRVRSVTAVSVPHPSALSRALAEDAKQREMSSYMQLFRRPEQPEDLLLEDDARRLRALFGDATGVDVEKYVSLLSDRTALTAALGWYRAQDRAAFHGVPPVAVPATFVWPDADVAIGATAARLCGEYVTGDYRFEVLEGVSHWAPEEAPEQVAALVLQRTASAP